MGKAELSPSGDIMVDGQTAGRLEGFRVQAANEAFLPEIKAEFLPQELEMQAERFAAAPNGDIAIAQDGSVRWRGFVIAKLKADNDILRPAFILLADEALSAAAREKIESRLARFIVFHFETTCKPLYDLAAAEALLEKPRAVADKVVENLGIVPRREIAAQVKELDQESRAALRRFGVRFGVYNIFMPMMLKPAPAQALTLLWALKHDAFEHPGYGEVIAGLAAGRTSFNADENYDRQFYRLAGYRVLGKKAVRIDMLERCADLIRQAVSWKPPVAKAESASAEGQPAGQGQIQPERPDGAYDGRQFTMTQAMLSILGTTAEDMEEILRNLGYVSESISPADYKAFLDKQAPKAEKMEGGASDSSVPAAEFVGTLKAAVDDGVAEAEAKGELKEAGAEDADAAPPAEPVGPKWAAKGAVAENAPVLLWHYQKRVYKKPQSGDYRRNFTPRNNNAGQAEGEGGAPEFKKKEFAPRGNRNNNDEGQKSGNHGKFKRDFSKSHDADNGGGNNGKFRNESKSRGNGGKKDGNKPRNFTSAKHSKPINIEDSPFAALMALRDKLGK